MAYANYDFYKNVYKGDILSESDYERCSVHAQAYLDFVTFDRVRSCIQDEKIQMAACAVAEAYALELRAHGIRSESAGTYSVSYQDGAFESAMYSAARRYLPAALLYRGVESGGRRP